MPDQTRRRGAHARLRELYPDVVERYEALSAEVMTAGPLSPKAVALAKVAVSIGSGAARTTHAHARKALDAGVTPEELRHLVIVALPTIGLPAALDALRRIDETIAESPAAR